MDYDPQLGDDIEALETLADMGYLDKEKPSFGIALRCFHEGYESLSPKQKYLYDSEISPVISKECACCGESIDLSALANAYDEGRMLCSYHMYRYQKDD